MTDQAIVFDPLFSGAQSRDLDQAAMATQDLPGIVLMKRAGRAAFNLLVEAWPDARALTVCCGAGNNGGDGYVIAALAQERGYEVQLVQWVPGEKLKGDARRAHDFAVQAGVAMIPWQAGLAFSGELIVDALLGTGLKGAPRDAFAAGIDAINASGLPVLAVDIPSGLDADTGAVPATAVQAALTATFIGLKLGLFTGRGPAHTGAVHYHDLGVDAALVQSRPALAQLLDLATCQAWLPPRARDAHKGDCGRVLVIGGDHGLGGAAIMAAEAAGRVGAGLVGLATQPPHVAAAIARHPEIMASAIPSGQELKPLLPAPDVLVLGPGLGRSPWGEQMLYQAAQAEKPMIVDADGLNLLAEGRLVTDCPRDNWILTPHPGEAARLLGSSATAVQADRPAAAAALQQRYGGVVVLKGAGTLIAGPDGALALSPLGNPGMASGGMGDVLSGILGGLLAQGLTLWQAACLGVMIHGAAADRAAAVLGERGLQATDLLPELMELVNGH